MYKTINIGIMPLEKYKARTIAIAKGEYTPKKDEPKIWFSSLKSMVQILANENRIINDNSLSFIGLKP